MDGRKPAGIAIFCLCIAGFFTYAYLVMLSEWGRIVLELSVLMIVGGVMGTVAWMGYTMATTKPTPSSFGVDGGGGGADNDNHDSDDGGGDDDDYGGDDSDDDNDKNDGKNDGNR